MRDAFICHSEKDAERALDLAMRLERAGFTTWYYERDNLPGESWLIQVGRAIEESRCMVLLVTPYSLASNEVTSEVVRAYESRVPIVPLLFGVAHREIKERQQLWRQALVTSTSLPIPPGGVGEVLPRVIRGLENLGIHPEKGGGDVPPPGHELGAAREPEPIASSPVAASKGASSKRRRPAKRWLIVAGVAMAFVAIAMNVYWIKGERSRHDQASRDGGAANGENIHDPVRAVASPLSEGAEPAADSRPAGKEETVGPAWAGTSKEIDPVAPAGRSERPVDAPVSDPAPVIVIVITGDSTGLVEEALASALRGLGHPARALEVIAGPALAKELRARDLDGDPGNDDLHIPRAMRALARVVGTARTTDVAQAHGFYSVRAEVRIRMVDEETGQILGAWTGSEKSSMPAREAARDAALRAASEEVAALADAALKETEAGRTDPSKVGAKN